MKSNNLSKSAFFEGWWVTFIPTDQYNYNCKATQGKKRMELLHDMMEGRDYRQLKDLISDRSRWRQDSKWECVSETQWKQQKTKEREIQLQTNIRTYIADLDDGVMGSQSVHIWRVPLLSDFLFCHTHTPLLCTVFVTHYKHNEWINRLLQGTLNSSKLFPILDSILFTT